LHIVAHLLDLPDETLGPVKKQAAGAGQEHPASVTDKKLHPKLLLEKLDLPAKPRLGDPETIRRFAKASEFRNRAERTQLSKIHGPPNSPANIHQQRVLRLGLSGRPISEREGDAAQRYASETRFEQAHAAARRRQRCGFARRPIQPDFTLAHSGVGSDRLRLVAAPPAGSSIRVAMFSEPSN
jgi:hypothetical protein